MPLLPVHPGNVHDALRFVESVHAFARSDIGSTSSRSWRLGIAATIYLILDAWITSRARRNWKACLARIHASCFNNLICWRAVSRCCGARCPNDFRSPLRKSNCARRRVYNRLMVPIGLFLLFLTAWDRCLRGAERRSTACANFQWPGIASLVLVGALIAAGMRQFYPLISFGFCLLWR